MRRKAVSRKRVQNEKKDGLCHSQKWEESTAGLKDQAWSIPGSLWASDQVTVFITKSLLCSWPTPVFPQKIELEFFQIHSAHLRILQYVSRLVQSNKQSLSMAAGYSWCTELIACEQLSLLQMTAAISSTVSLHLFSAYFCPYLRREVVSYREALMALLSTEHNATPGKTKERISEGLSEPVVLFRQWSADILRNF